MKIIIFQIFFALFFCVSLIANAQQTDNVVTIELSTTTFSIERPFTISVRLPGSDNRPVVTFPDITGLTKRGTATSLANPGSEGETKIAQIITQTYVANQPGTFRLLPFSITVNGMTARSEGAILMVRPASITTFSEAGGEVVSVSTESGAAFLTLRTSKTSVFVGEGFAIRLSLFVSDTYPFELRFDGVDAQLQTVLKQVRPTNAWEEDAGIRELKGLPVVLNNRPFTEYVIFQGVYFPLSDKPISIPSVALSMIRVKQDSRSVDLNSTPSGTASAPVASTAGSIASKRPTTSKTVAQTTVAESTERVTFQTRPLTITVRPLPSHPLRGQVSVGIYQLVESIDRVRVPAGKSARYSVRVEGEGNVASIQAPLWSNLNRITNVSVATPATEIGLETLPTGTSQQIDRTGERTIGSKTFDYFLVPRRGGEVDLSTVFGFVYFNLQTSRYDTLKSHIRLQVGETELTGAATVADTSQTNGLDDLYVGLNQMDSTKKPLNLTALARAVANVLLVLMILGMIFVFLRKP